MTEPRERLAIVLTDRYRIERELGAGGMAMVYLAEDTKHHRMVAVKMLRPELAESLGADRFLREIEIAARLHHPHILPLHDSGGADGVLYYVMPYVDGQSLRDRIAHVGAMPIVEAASVVREVLDALAYSHGRGVVHRDIKPENILLTGAHALVMDFGIAKAISEASNTTQLTSAGMAMGTPSYMAPEQITADPALDHRADLYAVGVMAYEMLTGRTPFSGDNAQQIIGAHLSRTPQPLSATRATVSAALEAVIMRALAKDPADRWQTANEMIDALNAAITSSSRPTRKRTAISVGAGAIVIALAAGGVAWFGKDGRAGTLIGNDVLAANDLVMVSEFQNRTKDSTLASTITDAVRAELQQTRVVKVMSQAAMWAGIRRMGLTPDSALAEMKLQELAEREGAKAFVVGDVARLGGGYHLTARVVATAGGAEALTVKATAADDSKLIGAVEELGRSLRKGIGESLRSVSSAPPLAQVMTSSLPALRLLTAARRAVNAGESARGAALATQALTLDTTFASAWSVLFVAYSNLGNVQSAVDAATHGYAMRERLSEAEALITAARYHGLRGDTAQEDAAYSRLQEMGRDHTNYANALLSRRRYAEAEAVQRRGIASDPKLSIGYWNLTEAQVAQRKFAAAESTVQRMTASLPTLRLTQQTIVAIPLARRDFETAAAFFTTPGGALIANAMPQYPCGIDLARGRVREAARCGPGRPVVTETFALAEYRMTGDTTRLRRGYEGFLMATPENRNPDLYATTIGVLAEVGKVREARRLFDEWRARSGAADPSFRADSSYAVGTIAAAEGQWDTAVTAFLAWNRAPIPSSFHWYSRGLPEAAMALVRLGKSDSSRVLLERALETPSLEWGWVYELTWYGQALQQLGDFYDARGDRAKAKEYFTKYVDLMKNADPVMAAQVAEVRRKLVKLGAEPAAPVIQVKRP